MHRLVPKPVAFLKSIKTYEENKTIFPKIKYQSVHIQLIYCKDVNSQTKSMSLLCVMKIQILSLYLLYSRSQYIVELARSFGPLSLRNPLKYSKYFIIIITVLVYRKQKYWPTYYLFLIRKMLEMRCMHCHLKLRTLLMVNILLDGIRSNIRVVSKYTYADTILLVGTQMFRLYALKSFGTD